MAFADTITIEALEADPYPIYARLRAAAPVAEVPAANLWMVTRWDDVDRVTKSPELFSAEVLEAPIAVSFGTPAILIADGAVHRELRAGIEPHYRAGKVAEYIDALVRPLAQDHLDRLRGNSRAELIADYFEPVSALALARSLGLMQTDGQTLRRWFHGLSQGAINFERDPARQAISDATCAGIDAVVLPLLARLATAPDGSPLSHMLHSGMQAGMTRAAERILPTIKITLLGGMQEPGHGAASTLVGLLQNPGQMAALRADPDRLIPDAIDEGVRWVAPIGTATRIAAQDVTIGGATIPKGATVAAVLASANHDESRFADAGRFDLHRPKQTSASFAFGAHFCAGKWFARAQMQIMLRVLIDALPDLALASLPVFRGWEFRAPAALHVTF
jgi:cytochrome P450